MTLDIESTAEGAGIEIRDPIERRVVSLRFPSAVSPEPAEADAFVYPVDRAVSVTTRTVTVKDGAAATILDPSGEVVMAANTESWDDEIPPGEYYVDVSSHVKTYLWVEATDGMEIERDDGTSTVRVKFGGDVEVRIGARSVHERPEATITTSPAPSDVMTAVSYLGSALKDDGPMRSFPSLRGHPPEIELGDELSIPEELAAPETGITIELPPAYEYVFPVAPLAYYLGAEVVPGDRPVLRARTDDREFEFDLDGPDGFEATVARVLKHVFTCDCFVRSGGPYSYELANREAFVRETGLDPEATYDRPLAEQVAAYLDVPFETVEPYVPEWGTGAHLEPLPTSVEYLPFLAVDLAVIRSPAARDASGTVGRSIGPKVSADGEFTRSATASDGATTDTDGLPSPAMPDVSSIGEVEGDSPVPSWPGSPPAVVSPEPLRTQGQRWIADGIPLGADRPTIESYRNALDRDPVEGDIDIVVVCNDDRMVEEDEAVRELLSARTPFDVTIRPHRNLLTEELRELLERGADFLHYVGHVGEDGFECPDGYLDASTLESVNVDAFFLNACRSYRQGRALIDAGAMAGVVTLEDVLNADAVRTGRGVARLLNAGFPLDTALRLASHEQGVEEGYTVVGDGGMQVTQAESVASLVEADPIDADAFEYRHRTFVTPQFPLGSVFTPTVEGVDGWYLAGEEARGRVSMGDLREWLTYEDGPVRIDGEFGWSSEVATRLGSVEEYQSSVRELADLAVELADSDGDREAAEDRLGELRERVEGLSGEFDSTDFRVAFRAVLDG